MSLRNQSGLIAQSLRKPICAIITLRLREKALRKCAAQCLFPHGANIAQPHQKSDGAGGASRPFALLPYPRAAARAGRALRRDRRGSIS